jgi:hypothetical protein
MAKIEYSKINKDKFISYLWHSLYDMAFLDIKRASRGKSKMGAFILSSCFIEYLTGFRYGKETNNADYKNFVKDYLPKYDKEKLYKDLRCKLVHNYSEGGSYTFVDKHYKLHLNETQDNKIVLNLASFVKDLENAINKYFTELKSSDALYKLAVDRYFKLGLLGIMPSLILKRKI